MKNEIFAISLLVASSSVISQTNSSLQTTTGHEFGFTISDYSYKEPSLSVKLDATKFGFEYTGTYAAEGWFIKGDIRYAAGDAKYSGSGTKNNVNDYYYDTRLLLGKDFVYNGQVFAPYIGYGYRYLFDDLRGTTSTGAAGYRRESNYWYIPVGLTHRMTFNSQSKIETTFEYDYLLEGKQISKLSDTVGYNSITRYDDATNKQSKGYGYRLAVSYQQSNWSFGPYYQYWSIDRSNTVYGYAVIGGTTYYGGAYEPKNSTNEYGVRFKYKF